ncbi:MAG: Coenzyme F420 hydrogenase/dehydrogenase, beta subunit C-terminal domain [Synergistaceae bacterium]|jgi:coenzyme F420-reducing hydrogenase beta subunit|nr:Coenzyme F420 hydrogenase/dehydrogenase, beta subunit C-terminal domain [Synergistaceae bacterium]
MNIPDAACTGCMACAAACPMGAGEPVLTRSEDERGFYVPKIDEARCIGCGRCEAVCPAKHPVAKAEGQVYACRTRDPATLSASSSGGVFMELASDVLAAGGVAAGAAFDEDLRVVHIVVDSPEKLRRLQGSKYVQSDMSAVYAPLKAALDAGRPALFSGTPCQAAAVRRVFGDNAGLLVADLLCHGTPSMAVFRAYLEWTRQEAGFGKIDGVKFRLKKPGWKTYSVEVSSGGRTVARLSKQDPYIRGFLGGLYLRECCYGCQYAGPRRVGDLTIADYWGYSKEPDGFEDDDRGISLVMVNTDKGAEAFGKMEGRIDSVRRDIADAAKHNWVLHDPSARSERSGDFWAGLGKVPFGSLVAQGLAAREK